MPAFKWTVLSLTMLLQYINLIPIQKRKYTVSFFPRAEKYVVFMMHIAHLFTTSITDFFHSLAYAIPYTFCAFQMLGMIASRVWVGYFGTCSHVHFRKYLYPTQVHTYHL